MWVFWFHRQVRKYAEAEFKICTRFRMFLRTYYNDTRYLRKSKVYVKEGVNLSFSGGWRIAFASMLYGPNPQARLFSPNPTPPQVSAESSAIESPYISMHPTDGCNRERCKNAVMWLIIQLSIHRLRMERPKLTIVSLAPAVNLKSPPLLHHHRCLLTRLGLRYQEAFHSVVHTLARIWAVLMTVSSLSTINSM